MKVRKVFFYFFLLIAMLISLALGFVEIRTLIAGDFALAESPIKAALGYGFRFAFFVFVLLILISRGVGEAQKDKGMSFQFTIIYIIAIIGAAVSFLFYDWYFSAALFVSLFASLVLSSFQPAQ